MAVKASRADLIALGVMISGGLLVTSGLMWSVQSYTISTIFFILSILTLFFIDTRYHGVISYRTILLVPLSMYAATPFVHIGFEGNSYGLNHTIFTPFLWGSWTFILILLLSLPSGFKAVEAESQTLDKSLPGDDKFVIAISILTGTFFMYLWTSIDMSGTARAERISGQTFTQTIAELLFISSIIAYTCSIGQRSRKIMQIAVIFVGIYTASEIFLFGDRRTALSLMAGIVFLMVLRRRMFIKAWHVLALLFALPIILIFGVLRAFPPGRWFDLLTSGQAFSNFSLMKSELGASAIVANVIGQHQGVLTFDPSYHLIPVQLVPSAIISKWEGVYSPSQQFTYYFRYDVYAKGGGFGYNILLESFHNFVLIGPVFLALFLALVFRLANQLKGDLKDCVLAAFGFATIFIFRMDLISWAQTFLYVSVLAMAVYAVTSFVGIRNRSISSPNMRGV